VAASQAAAAEKAAKAAGGGGAAGGDEEASTLELRVGRLRSAAKHPVRARVKGQGEP
jgi:hypothetical protein